MKLGEPENAIMAVGQDLDFVSTSHDPHAALTFPIPWKRCKHFRPTLMISNATPLFTPTDHFTCRSKCRLLIMKLLNKFHSNRDAILVIKFVAFWRASRDFSGVRIPTGPF